MKTGNRYDDLIVNVPEIFSHFPITEKKPDKRGQKFSDIFTILYRFEPLPLVVRKYLWYFLKRIGLDANWFYNFKHYWEEYLGGITLWGVEDFYFLRGVYRQKFHHLSLPRVNSEKTHLATWQKPAAISFLLDMVYRESLYNQLATVNLYFKYRQEETLPIMEFGSATGPITTTLFEFYNLQDKKIYISDLQTLAFHYGIYKFKDRANVIPVILEPKDHFSPRSPEKLGAIFCMTVFEHLNDSPGAAKKFHDLLSTNGLLIFDYLNTEGKGLDSLSAVKDRNKTLRFISQHFKIVHGNIWNESGNNTIVARKK